MKCIKCFAIWINVLYLSSCSDIDVIPNRRLLNEESPLSLIDSSGGVHVPFFEDSCSIHILLPNGIDFTKVKFYISNKTGYSVVLKDGEKAREGMLDLSSFLNTISLEYVDERSDTVVKTVHIYDLPVLIINTPNGVPISSKEERVKGCEVKLIEEYNKVTDLGTAGIRGRGNSTWLQEKKPYNIKFDKKNMILGMRESKNWVLLANAYYDRTQIHNDVAFEIARMTDFDWVPSGQFVELLLNGEHRGLYYLCEKIGVETGKIDIIKAEENTPVENCGYLLESYVNVEENANPDNISFPFGFFHTDVFYQAGSESLKCVLGWEIKEPDGLLSQEHVNYIKGSLTSLETLIKEQVSSGEYRDFFDIESAINWWLVEEISLNEEASRSKNIYLYKEGEVFKLGPPWDFDAWTFGQIAPDKRDWSLNNTLYFGKLFNDPVFVKRLKDKWVQYSPEWEKVIPSYIDNRYRMIHRAAERNEVMWSHWNNRNKYPDVSYAELIEEMKFAFLEQLDIMRKTIDNL